MPVETILLRSTPDRQNLPEQENPVGRSPQASPAREALTVGPLLTGVATMSMYTRQATRRCVPKIARTYRDQVSSSGRAPTTDVAFIVRFKHRSRPGPHYLASFDFSVAEISPHRSEAWRFPSHENALRAARLALGFTIISYAYEIIPARSS
jgi:hypothetical protein